MKKIKNKMGKKILNINLSVVEHSIIENSLSIYKIYIENNYNDKQSIELIETLQNNLKNLTI